MLSVYLLTCIDECILCICVCEAGVYICVDLWIFARICECEFDEVHMYECVYLVSECKLSI